MCGIFGWVAGGRPVAHAGRAIDAALNGMRHRGPDDHGVSWREPGGAWHEGAPNSGDPCDVLLGHVRLSILDLSPLGRQPMATADGRFRISFNGEVYNYLELRRELEAEGIMFRTHTDTEVVLYAFARWGLACLNRFTGMFAMAIHDQTENRLYLIRDHFGIKPLFYTAPKDGPVSFASELPVLLEFPGVKRRANAQRVYDYLLFGDYDSLEDTMIEGVRHLSPGHCLVLDCETGNILERRRYWQIDLNRKSELSFDAAAKRFRELFLDNVRLHLRSDVPLGAALSGGVDSSAVTCAIRHLEPDMPLKTFTYVAKGSSVDEERWADQVIRHVRAESFKVEVQADELVSDLDALIRAQGEPFGSTSIYAQYRVFRLAHEAGVTVTLDGQGADEMLAGYLGFPGERLKSLIVRGQLMQAWRFFQATSSWPGRSRSEVFKRLVAKFMPEWIYPLARSVGRGSVMPSWLNAEWFRERGVRFDLPRVAPVYEKGCDYVRRELARQLTQRGLPALLRHGDRNSMHFSIESRVPFLTRELVEFALSLPEHYLIDEQGRTKAVFKEAMRGIVPDAILDRRDKVGFATPEQDWLTQLDPWVRETLVSADHVPCLKGDAMNDAWEEILTGRRRFDWQVWRWLNLISWARMFEVEFHSS